MNESDWMETQQSALDQAMGIISNVKWEFQTEEWQFAARDFLDRYVRLVAKEGGE